MRGLVQRGGVAALVAALAWLASMAARTDEPRAPAVTAQLLIPLPADSAIAIAPRDDSDENLRLRDLMVARLVERRGRVAEDAPLVLRFATAVVSDRDSPTSGRGDGGRHGGRRNFGAAPITGMRNAPSGGPAGRPNGTVLYRLAATLERRDGGQVLWKGEVTAVPAEQNERTLPAQLAAALVDHIGHTVDTRRPADTAPASTPR
jgi:hypothetical protein